MLEAMMRNKQFVRHPLVKFFKDKKPWLVQFHAELVEEIRVRFGSEPSKHQSPVPSAWRESLDPAKVQEILWPESWLEFDREDLRRRSFEKPKLRFKATQPPPWWRKDSDLQFPLGVIPIHSYANPETFGKYIYEGEPAVVWR
jgi:hypothetical protein